MRVSVESDDLVRIVDGLKVACTWLTSARSAKLAGYAQELEKLANPVVEVNGDGLYGQEDDSQLLT